MRTPISGALALVFVLASPPIHAATVNGLIYAAEGTLRVVDFDGSGFTSTATVLTEIIPDWTAMQLLFAAEAPPPAIPLPAAGWSLLIGIGAFAAMRRRLRLRFGSSRSS